MNSGKRQNFLNWEDYFMSIALVSAQRSKDPVTQVGACIINEEKRIVGVGYNGFPSGCSDDDFPWGKDSDHSKHLYVIHAEENAVLNRFSADLKNCTMFVTLFPCNKCARIIIQSGIKHIVYMSDKKSDTIEVKASKRMLEAVGVEYKQFQASCKGLRIDLHDSENQTLEV